MSLVENHNVSAFGKDDYNDCEEDTQQRTALASKTVRTMEFDEYLIKVVGQFGRWQVFLLLLISMEAVFGAFYSMTPVFVAAVPEHWCRLPDINNTASNCTSQQIKDVFIPRDGKAYESCFSYNVSVDELGERCGNTSMVETSTRLGCQEYEYSSTYYDNTIVSEWDLVCERASIVSTSNAVFMAGRVAGAIVFGPLTDRLGRRPMVLALMLVQILSGLMAALSPGYLWFIAARFLLGFVGVAKGTAAFVIVIEITGPDWRVTAGGIISIIWALGYVLFAGVAYAFRHYDWRYLALAIALPEIILLALYIPLIPESPRWQLVKMQEKAAMKTLHKMRRRNGRTIPEDEVNNITVITSVCLCLCVLRVVAEYIQLGRRSLHQLLYLRCSGSTRLYLCYLLRTAFWSRAIHRCFHVYW